jgi:hypothetical protein
MSYSKDLSAVVLSNQPAELEINFELMIHRLQDLGGKIFPVNEKLPDLYKHIFTWKSKGTPVVFFGTKKTKHYMCGEKKVLPYSYRDCHSFTIKWKHAFEENKLVFTPYIYVEYYTQGTHEMFPVFDTHVESMTDLLPVKVEIQMKDCTLKLQVPSWVEAVGDD